MAGKLSSSHFSCKVLLVYVDKQKRLISENTE